MISTEEARRVLAYFYPEVYPESARGGADVSAAKAAVASKMRDEFVAGASGLHYSFNAPFAAPGASNKVTQILGSDWKGLKTDRFDQLRRFLAEKYKPAHTAAV